MEKHNPPPDFPPDFRCPISMELMRDPVTISTGVTYDRRNIEKWFHVYGRKICPATMQSVQTLDTTPNLTLKRLIDAWLCSCHPTQPEPPPELARILESLDSSPFRVSWLRKLRSALAAGGDDVAREFKRSGGVEMLVRIVAQAAVSAEDCDFASLRACEEALGILHVVPFDDGDDEAERLLRPECTAAMAAVLRKGGSESRFWAISIFLRMSAGDDGRWCQVARDQGVDFFKSLLETASDEVCSTASSCALQLLIQILHASQKSRLKAIEAGAMCSLVELLPESNRSRSEKILQLIKLMCESADGRVALIEHGLGIAAVSKKMTNVSYGATRVGVKILWLLSSFHPTERVLEEMLACGAVRKMVALLQETAGGGRGSTKERVVMILKKHGGAWRRYPCFPAGGIGVI